MPRIVLALDSNGKLCNASDLPKGERAALEDRLREHKYGAVAKEANGIVFPSAHEAKQYQELSLLKACGEIVDLQRQVVFVLQEEFRWNGKRILAVTFIVDFVAVWRDGRKEVIEAKGVKTPVYRLKRKMFMRRYPEYGFREV